MPTFKVKVQRVKHVVQETVAEVWADSWADVQGSIDDLETAGPEFGDNLAWSTEEVRVDQIHVVDYLDRIPDPPQ